MTRREAGALSMGRRLVRSNCRSLGSPGFPVELGGVGELHAPFLTERRTRGPILCCVAENPGSLGMTKGQGGASIWRDGSNDNLTDVAHPRLQLAAGISGSITVGGEMRPEIGRSV